MCAHLDTPPPPSQPQTVLKQYNNFNTQYTEYLLSWTYLAVDPGPAQEDLAQEDRPAGVAKSNRHTTVKVHQFRHHMLLPVCRF